MKRIKVLKLLHRLIEESIKNEHDQFGCIQRSYVCPDKLIEEIEKELEDCDDGNHNQP